MLITVTLSKHLQTLSTADCISVAKSSFPCFCSIPRFLFRLGYSGLFEPRGWRLQSSSPLEVHNHRASIAVDVACFRASVANLQPMQLGEGFGNQANSEPLAELVGALGEGPPGPTEKHEVLEKHRHRSSTVGPDLSDRRTQGHTFP